MNQTLALDVFKAQPVQLREDPPDLVIRASKPFPTTPNDTADLAEARQLHRVQGEAIVDALAKSLPRGTMDAVLVAMLQRAATAYVAPLEPPPKVGKGKSRRATTDTDRAAKFICHQFPGAFPNGELVDDLRGLLGRVRADERAKLGRKAAK